MSERSMDRQDFGDALCSDAAYDLSGKQADEVIAIVLTGV